MRQHGDCAGTSALETDTHNCCSESGRGRASRCRKNGVVKVCSVYGLEDGSNVEGTLKHFE